MLIQRIADFYGINSLQHQSALLWNKLQNQTNNNITQELRSKKKRTLLIKINNC